MSSAKGESEGVAQSLLRDAIGAAPAGTFASDYLQQMCKDGSSASALAWLAIGLLTATAKQQPQDPRTSTEQGADVGPAAPMAPGGATKYAQLLPAPQMHTGHAGAQRTSPGQLTRSPASQQGCKVSHAQQQQQPHSTHDSLSDTHASAHSGSPHYADGPARFTNVAEQQRWQPSPKSQVQQHAFTPPSYYAPAVTQHTDNQCNDWRVTAPAGMTEEQLESSIAEVLACGRAQKITPASQHAAPPQERKPISTRQKQPPLPACSLPVRDGSSTSIAHITEPNDTGTMASVTERAHAHRAMLCENRMELQRVTQAVRDAKRRLEAPDEVDMPSEPQPKRPRALSDEERRERRLRSNRESARRARARMSAHVTAQNNLINTLQRQVAEQHAALEASTNDVALLRATVQEWQAQHQAAHHQVQQQTNVLEMLHRVCNSAATK